jgi:hypothetical protein
MVQDASPQGSFAAIRRRRTIMRHFANSLAILAFAALPAFAAGHGGSAGSGGHGAGMNHGMSSGHGAGASTHGAAVSGAAHQAKLSGAKVGPQVRAVARTNHGHTKTHTANHGSIVSQTAHAAHSSGQKVGPQVRAVARSNPHAKTHGNGHVSNASSKHAHS